MATEEELVKKYKQKLREELGVAIEKSITKPVLSAEYYEFKKAFLPKHLTVYERACQISEKICSSIHKGNKYCKVFCLEIVWYR